nr:MAG TPA: hypothetical protein [Caudoviricetes sp.]
MVIIMKLELRKNMYVRNCYGRIAKIEYIEDNTAYCDNWLYQSYEDHITFINLDDEDDIDEILKTSYNIIDILEVGDYVNGSKVIEIEKDYKFIDGTIRDILWTDTKMQRAIWDETIKSIITKEQMEKMTYKVGE